MIVYSTKHCCLYLGPDQEGLTRVINNADDLGLSESALKKGACHERVQSYVSELNPVLLTKMQNSTEY